MNKRGLYFATLSVVLIMLIMIGFGIVRENKIAENNVDKVGLLSVEIINKNLEGEKLKFSVEDAIDLAIKKGLRSAKEDIDFRNSCSKLRGYVILENCDYIGFDLAFENYFIEFFDNFLRNYNLNSGNFEIVLRGNILEIKGEKKLDLNVKGDKIGELSANLNFDKEVGYDFNEFLRIVDKANNIKICFKDGETLDSCSLKESNDYEFKVKEEPDKLLFDIQEYIFDEDGDNIGDVFKFGLDK